MLVLVHFGIECSASDSHSMEVDDVAEERAESFANDTDANGSASALLDGPSVTKKKRHSVEATMWEKTLESELDVERGFSGWASNKIIELQRERNAALLDAQCKKIELECMKRKARDERNDTILDIQNTRKELECLKKQAQYDKCILYDCQAELSSTQEQRNVLETEIARRQIYFHKSLVSTRAEKNRLKSALETMQRSLQQLTEDKKQLEITYEAELDEAQLDRAEKNRLESALETMQRSLQQLTENKKQLEITYEAELDKAQLDRDNLESELQQSAIAKGKVEDEVLTLQQDQNRLNIALETMQKSLEEERESKLCKICLESPKDAICLPCVHADYCFRCLEQHREKSRSCPTCRSVLSGVLRSDIGV